MKQHYYSVLFEDHCKNSKGERKYFATEDFIKRGSCPKDGSYIIYHLRYGICGLYKLHRFIENNKVTFIPEKIDIFDKKEIERYHCLYNTI